MHVCLSVYVRKYIKKKSVACSYMRCAVRITYNCMKRTVYKTLGQDVPTHGVSEINCP